MSSPVTVPAKPVTHNLASVTVLHDQCVYADALATGLLVLGPDKGFALAERRSIPALFLIRQKDGKIEEKATKAFLTLAELGGG